MFSAQFHDKLFLLLQLQAVCSQWRDVASLPEVRRASFCTTWRFRRLVTGNDQRSWSCLQVFLPLCYSYPWLFASETHQPHTSTYILVPRTSANYIITTIETISSIIIAVCELSTGLCFKAFNPGKGVCPVNCCEAWM